MLLGSMSIVTGQKVIKRVREWRTKLEVPLNNTFILPALGPRDMAKLDSHDAYI